MNKIIEATKEDGTRQLVPTSLMREYAKEAVIVTGRDPNRAMRTFGRMIANLMYVRGYSVLIEIAYDSEGNQKRTPICVKGGVA